MSTAPQPEYWQHTEETTRRCSDSPLKAHAPCETRVLDSQPGTQAKRRDSAGNVEAARHPGRT